MTTESPVSVFMNQVQSSAKEKFKGVPYELRLEGPYASVVYRLGHALPIDVMLDWYTAPPEAKEGVRVFPWQRINLNFIHLDDLLKLAEESVDENKIKRFYQSTSQCLAKTLLWIDVGWGGIENFAANPDATSNWETGKENRVQYIITKGEDWIRRIVLRYLALRKIYDPKYGEDDVFRQYDLESLLTPYEANSPMTSSGSK